jgi:HAD superfamily hydrolase (TIGR01509 family)
MTKGLTGVIFDFNGVLCWDTAEQGEAWSRYAQVMRGSPLRDEETAEHVVGRDNRYILHYLTGIRFKGAELVEHTERKESIYRNLCLERGAAFRLSPGAEALLDTLKDMGVRRSIATSAGEVNVRFYFEHLRLARWFDFEQVVFDDDTSATKPAPDPYLRVAAKLGLAPAQCAAVEDSRHGVQSARAAGIGFIIALGVQADHAYLSRLPGVGLVVENLGQVPAGELFAGQA